MLIQPSGLSDPAGSRYVISVACTAVPWQPALLQRAPPTTPPPHTPSSVPRQQSTWSCVTAAVSQCLRKHNHTMFVINNLKIWQTTSQRSWWFSCADAYISGWGCERLPHVQIDSLSEYLRDNRLYSSVFKLENVAFHLNLILLLSLQCKRPISSLPVTSGRQERLWC